MSNNIRTISQLDKFEVSSIDSLSANDVYIEISKGNNSVNTFRLSMKDFLSALIKHIKDDGDKSWWVTLTTDQKISGIKTFNNTVNFGNDTQISVSSGNAVISSDNIIEGTSRKALWA